MNNENILWIDVGEYKYKVNTKISFRDLTKIKEVLQDSKADYKYEFASLIHAKIASEIKPELDKLYSSENLNILAEKYIMIDDRLKHFYNLNCQNLEFYEAIFTSINDKYEEEIKELAKTLLDNEAFVGVTNRIKELQQSIAKMVTSSALENFTKIARTLTESLRSISINVGEMLQSIKVPTISEARKQELRSSYKNWGNYGWTMMPDLPMHGFADCPTDIKEANKIALRYCTNKDMEHLFNLLRSMKGIKKSDLEEAIFDFEHKKYKSCILILFGLIDAKLIRLQRKENNPKNSRKVGVGAARKVLENIKKEKEIEKKFILLLDFENIFACLITVFAHGEDFRKQPHVINRNFVDHGMLTKRVVRKDCVQLFLLYYNLLNFLNFVS